MVAMVAVVVLVMELLGQDEIKELWRRGEGIENRQLAVVSLFG